MLTPINLLNSEAARGASAQTAPHSSASREARLRCSPAAGCCNIGEDVGHGRSAEQEQERGHPGTWVYK